MTELNALPSADVPLSEAMKRLTGFECLAIQDHFGRDMESLGAIRLTIALAWAYANRAGKYTWPDIKSRPIDELNAMFTEESMEPEDAAGKAEPSASPKTDA